MKRSRHRIALSLACIVVLAATVLACASASAPRPARETGQPAPTACTSAEVQFLHNQ